MSHVVTSRRRRGRSIEQRSFDTHRERSWIEYAVRAILIALAVLLAIAFAQVSVQKAAAHSPDDDDDALVQVSRIQRDGELQWSMTVEFGPGFEGDKNEFTDALADVNGFTAP